MPHYTDLHLSYLLTYLKLELRCNELGFNTSELYRYTYRYIYVSLALSAPDTVHHGAEKGQINNTLR